jgi:hypothetical protein
VRRLRGAEGILFITLLPYIAGDGKMSASRRTLSEEMDEVQKVHRECCL